MALAVTLDGRHTAFNLTQPPTFSQRATRICLSSLAGAGAGVAFSLALRIGALAPIFALIGGVIGLATQIFYSIIAKKPTPAQLRVSHLTNLSRQLQGPRVIQAIDSVKSILAQNTIQLGQTFHNHFLHHEITVITDEVRNRDDLKRTWAGFLTGLNGLRVQYPDGIYVALDFSEEISRLNNIHTPIQVSMLDHRNPRFQTDMQELLLILRECAGGGEYGLQESLRNATDTSEQRCVIVRKANTQEVLGCLWSREERDTNGHLHLYVAEVGRKANCARLGIAESLMRQFLSQDFSRYDSVYLHARASNRTAINLYQRFGFNIVETNSNYYITPPQEHAVRMVLNRAQQSAVA